MKQIELMQKIQNTWIAQSKLFLYDNLDFIYVAMIIFLPNENLNSIWIILFCFFAVNW